MKAARADLVIYFEALRERLSATESSRERGRLVRTASARFGRSENWTYERLREAGWRSGRKPRRDKGASKLERPDLEVLAGILAVSTRKTGKRLLPMRSAIEVARNNDRLAVDVTPKTLGLRLKQEGLHPRQLARPTPHTSMRSRHPNHVWQLDASVCVLFYLNKGGAEIMDEGRFYKNKPQNFERIKKQRVWRYVMTDHYSGAFYFKYYCAPGESQDLVFNFVMDAFTRRSHPQDPFHGVPEMLVWDAGSANQAYMIRNLLDRLTVKHWAHQVGNPRAKGQNECAQNLIERDFEGRLAFTDIGSVGQLNDLAHRWMRHDNGTRIHSRHGHTRYGLWQTIRPAELRICPPRDLCERLLTTKPVRRQVRGDLTIGYAIDGYGSNEYSVAKVPGIRAGESIDVCVNPYRVPSIVVYAADENGELRPYECEPIARDAAGFPIDAPVFGETFKQPPDTDVDRNRKAVYKRAYEVETQAEVDEARRRRNAAFGGRIDAFSYLDRQTTAVYMERPGRTLDVPPAIEVDEQPMTVIRAAKRLIARLGQERGRHAYAWLKTHYPQGVPVAEFEAIVARFNAAEVCTSAARPQADTGG